MDQSTHVIDLDGEVIIVLRKTDSRFAELDNNIQDTATKSNNPEGNTDTDTEKRKLTHKMKKKKKKRKQARASLETNSQLTEEPAVAEELDIVTDELTETGIDEQQEENCFRIQVSAKHLILASPVCKKILTGGWKESVTFLQKGSVEITAESWDLEAFLILLRIIHCQFYLVPRKLTLEMLAKVAVVAEYYDCREAVDIIGQTWINALEEIVPSTYCRDLILWLWVSWFFQLPSQFKKATSTVMSWSDNWFDNLGLPIPINVIRSMDDRRQGAITDLVHQLHETREKLLNDSRGCNYECSSIMYGALTKQLQSNALLWPRPEAPFLGLSYKSLVQRVLSFTSPRWTSGSSSYHSYQHSCCDSSFKTLFGVLKDTIEGLDLDSLTHG